MLYLDSGQKWWRGDLWLASRSFNEGWVRTNPELLKESGYAISKRNSNVARSGSPTFRMPSTPVDSPHDCDGWIQGAEAHQQDKL